MSWCARGRREERRRECARKEKEQKEDLAAEKGNNTMREEEGRDEVKEGGRFCEGEQKERGPPSFGNKGRGGRNARVA